MDYGKIEVFLDLVRTRNITKTAQRLYLTQSAVSKRLASLEEELSCRLVQRTRGRREILLTRQGERFIAVAERWKKVYEETELLKHSSLSSIVVGISESAYYGLIAPFLREFIKVHPDIRIIAEIYNSDQIYEMMDNHLLDYGIVAYESSRPGMSCKCINRQKLCLIRYDEAPGEIRSINAEELDPSKEIRFTGGNFRGMLNWREKWFGGINQSQLEINTVQGIVPFLRESDYWAVCTTSMAESIARDVSIQIYAMDDCMEIWEIFLLKKEYGEEKMTESFILFEQELAEYVGKNI